MIKPIDQFAICRTNSDWRATRCKSCAVEVKAEWRKNNPERAKQASQKQALKDKGLNKRLKYSRKYYQTHKALCHHRTTEWRKNNREYANAKMLERHKRRLQENPNYRFSYNIRGRIRGLLRGHRKSASTEQLLGCTVAEFRKYLETQWEPWMSWDNYGNKHGQWCIDHVMPVYAFDLSDPDQQKLCFHYTNLRPLCCKLNREKWHRYEPEELAKLRQKVFPASNG